MQAQQNILNRTRYLSMSSGYQPSPATTTATYHHVNTSARGPDITDDTGLGLYYYEHSAVKTLLRNY